MKFKSCCILFVAVIAASLSEVQCRKGQQMADANINIEIKNRVETFMDAWNNDKLVELGPWYTEDAVFMMQGAPTQEGRDSITAFLVQLQTNIKRIEETVSEVEVLSNKSAFLRGVVRGFAADGTQITPNFRLLMVYKRKNIQSPWLFHREALNFEESG